MNSTIIKLMKAGELDWPAYWRYLAKFILIQLFSLVVIGLLLYLVFYSLTSDIYAGGVLALLSGSALFVSPYLYIKDLKKNNTLCKLYNFGTKTTGKIKDIEETRGGVLVLYSFTDNRGKNIEGRDKKAHREFIKKLKGDTVEVLYDADCSKENTIYTDNENKAYKLTKGG